jgi:oxygen-dependent protoporphyrinogen oxidase
MSPPPRPTVAVIGGGIAGLSAAWELSGPGGSGPRVVVFEAGGRTGGKLRTESFGGREIDLGPDAFVARRPEALALCAELGLSGELVEPGSRRAYVYARGQLRPLPTGLALGVPTRVGPLARSGICSPTGVARAGLDLLRPSGAPHSEPETEAEGGAETRAGADRAVGEIVRRRLGQEVTTRLAGPLIGGIHAGAIDDMSAAAVFPALLEADRRPGSLMRALRATMPPTPSVAPVFVTLRGGAGRLADELARALQSRGVELRCDTPVRSLALVTEGSNRRWMVRTDGDEGEADGVVIAVPTATAAGLLRPHDASLADALVGVAYSTVAIITMRFPDRFIHHSLDGTGFLVPRGEGREADPLVTACTWLSSKWPGLRRPGDVLLRASVGRSGDNRYEALDDDTLVASVVAELGPMTGVVGPPLDALVTRWPEAFPQYAVGHLDRVSAIEAMAGRLPSLSLAGAAFGGVGVPACIAIGRRAARAVLAGAQPGRPSRAP